MKHKVGDKVKVRKDLIVDEDYGEATFVGDMVRFMGTEQLIYTANIEDDGYEFYQIEEDGRSFTDEMLED